MKTMKTIFKVLALGLLLMTVASCEMHDPFDENTITGAMGPETYWTVESSMVKAGGSVDFTAQYYSTVAPDYVDHTEVWYSLFEKEDKVVTASLIKAFTYSETSSTTAQKRVLQTIQSYAHSQDLWSDSLHAYELKDKFPVSNTLSPVTWANPADSNGISKNLHTYFGEDFAKNFKEGLTRKMHSHDGLCANTANDSVRNYAAYMNAFQPAGLLDSVIITPNGDKMSYLQWISDSTFNANSNSWEKFFKKYDTIWSKVNFDTLGYRWDTVIKTVGRPPRPDTTITQVWITKPWIDSVNYVYPQIVQLVDSIWDKKVTFYDLIKSADGYSIEYKREYYINAEFRVYDKKGFDPAKHEEGAYTEGTYSSTDAKEIAIN